MLPTATTMTIFALLHIGGPYHSVQVTSPRDIFLWHLNQLPIEYLQKNVLWRHRLARSVIILQTRKIWFVVWCLHQTTSIEYVNRLYSGIYCYATLCYDISMIIYDYFMFMSSHRGCKGHTCWKCCWSFVQPMEVVFMHIRVYWTQIIPSTHSCNITQCFITIYSTIECVNIVYCRR